MKWNKGVGLKELKSLILLFPLIINYSLFKLTKVKLTDTQHFSKTPVDDHNFEYYVTDIQYYLFQSNIFVFHYWEANLF